MNSPSIVSAFITHGQEWVRSQRSAHRPHARALPADIGEHFGQFFEGATLERARFKSVPRLENPDFYATLSESVVPRLDFTKLPGITFDDTVLISQAERGDESLLPALLFHELVHVVQYHLLGVEIFIERYVHGWAANGYEYLATPFEQDAYHLQRRYQADWLTPFSVEAEIRERL